LFYLSKTLSLFKQPLIWAAVSFLLALWCWWSRWPIAALWTLLAATGLTAVVGWMPEALLPKLNFMQRIARGEHALAEE